MREQQPEAFRFVALPHVADKDSLDFVQRGVRRVGANPKRCGHRQEYYGKRALVQIHVALLKERPIRSGIGYQWSATMRG